MHEEHDPAETRCYSMPKSMHEQVAREAAARPEKNKSLVVRDAVRFWFKVHGETPAEKVG